MVKKYKFHKLARNLRTFVDKKQLFNEFSNLSNLQLILKDRKSIN